MACFLVPATEALITTVAAGIIKSKEQKKEKNPIELHDSNGEAVVVEKPAFSRKLGWLNKMLWGGSSLLFLEHVWHGEIVPQFPFLTVVQNGETAGMLAEMGTGGIGMAALVTAVWAAMLAVSRATEKQAIREDAVKAGEMR